MTFQSLSTSKATFGRVNRQPTEWEKSLLTIYVTRD